MKINNSIGYVVGDFPVYSETFIGTEIRAMKKLNYQISTFAFNITRDKGQAIDTSLLDDSHEIGNVSKLEALLTWLSHPIRSFVALFFIIKQTGLPKLSLALSCAQLAYLAKQNNCRHLHAHFALFTAASAIAAAKLSGLSVSFVGHGYDIYAQPCDLALKIRMSNFSVAVCEHMKEKFQALAPNKTISMIPCGIDVDRYPYRPKKKHNNKILFIGRLTEKKGLNYLIEALAQIDIKDRPILDIVGIGELKEDLSDQVLEYNLTDFVNFLGAKSSLWIIEHASHYLALCAPFCLAKNGDRDTGPLVIKEAMALGLPVICTNFMGCNEIMSPECGFLLEPKQSKPITQAIIKIQKLSSSERLAILDNARNRVIQLYSDIHSATKLAYEINGNN